MKCTEGLRIVARGRGKVSNCFWCPLERNCAAVHVKIVLGKGLQGGREGGREGF